MTRILAPITPHLSEEVSHQLTEKPEGPSTIWTDDVRTFRLRLTGRTLMMPLVIIGKEMASTRCCNQDGASPENSPIHYALARASAKRQVRDCLFAVISRSYAECTFLRALKTGKEAVLRITGGDAATQSLMQEHRKCCPLVQTRDDR
jgi:hypothetical protein